MHKLRRRERRKLLVVAHLQDAPQLDMLAERSQQHGIMVEKLDEQQLRYMEPQARSGTGQSFMCQARPQAIL